jgi:hypothetical protein
MKLSALLLLSTFTGSNAFYKTHDIITHDDGSVHLFEKTQHRRLATKNLKTNSDAANTKFTVHGSQYVTGKMHVDGIATVGGLEFENNDDIFGSNALASLAGAGLSVSGNQLQAATHVFGTTAGTSLEGDTTTISGAQASAITANTAKVSMALGTTSSTALAGDTTTISGAQASAITANTAKVSMALGTSSSTALAGDTTTISGAQASEITANTAKVSMALGTTSSTALAGDTTTISGAQASEITANTAKVSMALGTTSSTALAGDTTTISGAQASEITANTAKVSMALGTTSSTALAGDTTTISGAQASEITANTAKIGVTASQASAIAANTAKPDPYRLEKMVLILCNTLGIKFEHLERAVDGTFDPYERFSAIQVNDDDLYSTDSNSNLVDVTTATAAALCSTKTDVACPTGLSNKHALARCAAATCVASDYGLDGGCCAYD